MRFLKGFGQFWYDFIIGDDWKIAVAVVAALAVVLALLLGGVTGPALAAFGGVLLIAFFTASVVIDVRRSR
ncbi:hypothetical protein HNP84_000974 [Thermocatellispora tengchongensis]|uniref:Uncharacterized protein n=1 Tax=Thermocatellispora tengchongensis TaxID=1073253 RepID=A0A840NUN3_9ACTN|nr:hypothetical protein [Thermocatellispora tengchongensis]MBB5131268.1 hypothetical protein [Thermocatellispora tengchongensis]